MQFKRAFDEYSEPVSYKQKYLDSNAFVVYYTQGFDGPNRPRIDVDDALSVKESQQYGFRNEAWIAVDEAISEIRYLKENNLMSDGREFSDLKTALSSALKAFDAYLKLAAADDVQKAIDAITNTEFKTSVT